MVGKNTDSKTAEPAVRVDSLTRLRGSLKSGASDPRYPGGSAVKLW